MPSLLRTEDLRLVAPLLTIGGGVQVSGLSKEQHQTRKPPNTKSPKPCTPQEQSKLLRCSVCVCVRPEQTKKSRHRGLQDRGNRNAQSPVHPRGYCKGTSKPQMQIFVTPRSKRTNAEKGGSGNEGLSSKPETIKTLTTITLNSKP